eukprot:11573638-Ditylum_brightwellii.AAC.1
MPTNIILLSASASAVSETPMNDTAYSMPTNIILLSTSAASETPVNDTAYSVSSNTDNHVTASGKP